MTQKASRYRWSPEAGDGNTDALALTTRTVWVHAVYPKTEGEWAAAGLPDPLEGVYKVRNRLQQTPLG